MTGWPTLWNTSYCYGPKYQYIPVRSQPHLWDSKRYTHLELGGNITLHITWPLKSLFEQCSKPGRPFIIRIPIMEYDNSPVTWVIWFHIIVDRDFEQLPFHFWFLDPCWPNLYSCGPKYQFWTSERKHSLWNEKTICTHKNSWNFWPKLYSYGQ